MSAPRNTFSLKQAVGDLESLWLPSCYLHVEAPVLAIRTNEASVIAADVDAPVVAVPELDAQIHMWFVHICSLRPAQFAQPG